MRFTHPEFLYALLALLIPILVHLFNFRRYRKILFSNIAFLKNISIETKKQNKLKHLLILLTRLFAIVFIVFAFAGPYFPNRESKKELSNVIMLYLDNSYSMKAEGEQGRLYDEALRQSIQLTEKSAKDERFSILSNNPSEGTSLLNKLEAKLILEKTTLGNHRQMLSSILKKQQRTSVKNKLKGYRSFIFSDFQKNQIDIGRSFFDTSAFYYFFPYKHKVLHNLTIDTCWFEQPDFLPGKQVHLKVRINNASAKPVEKISVKLFIDGRQKTLAGINIAANDYTIVSLGFIIEKKGWHKGRVQIDDYPITFDDRLLFSFNVRNKVKVLEIKEGGYNGIDYLKTFYSSDSIFLFSSATVTGLNNYHLSDFNLIILNELQSFSSGLNNVLTNYVKEGGQLMVIPPEKLGDFALNKFLDHFKAGRYNKIDTAADRVIDLKRSNPLFSNGIAEIPKNADFPIVHKHFPFHYNLQSGIQTYISLLNGDDFLCAKPFGAGKIYLLSVSLQADFSNFTENPLFTLLLYGAATQGFHSDKLYYIIGKDEYLTLHNNLPENRDEVLEIKLPGQNNRFIPMQRRKGGKITLSFDEGIPREGFYPLVSKDTLYRLLAFNRNRKESDMAFYNTEEIDSLLKMSNIKHYRVANDTKTVLKEVINTPQKESLLWKLFIIFALFMLLAESLIIRFWK